MYYKFKNSYLNNFFETIKFKKQYLEQLKNKIKILKYIKDNNYKSLNNRVYLQSCNIPYNKLIMYIVSIFFSRTNILLHVMDFSGKLKFFYSAGSFKFSGKSKKAKSLVLKKFYRIILNKLTFLKYKPISLHLENVGFNKFWVIKKLKRRLFIKVIKSFSSYSYNGCRKKKIRRKKFKRK